MRKITHLDICTSSLGFGCSSLLKHNSRRAAIRCLEEAYHNGVTHFDTAHAYCYGLSEGILGEFAKNKRANITITTKFGLSSRRSFTNNFFLLNAVSKLMNSYSGIKKNVLKTVGPVNRKVSITKESAQEFLDLSLKRMRIEYIDFYMLHDCNLEEANNEELLHFLDEAKRQGKIRYLGITGNFSEIGKVDLSEAYSTIQYCPYIISDPNTVTSKQRLHIHYNIFSSLFGENARVDINYALSNAARRNPNGINLFTSTQAQHIKSNIEYWNSL